MMQIAISKASGSPSYDNYVAWLKTTDPDVQTVDLSKVAIADMPEVLKTCSGLLLSGGEDIHPDRYGQPEKLGMCSTIDEQRDELELLAIHTATEMRMPILGICRGMQILNVAFGGTMIADIPSSMPDHLEHGKVDGQDSMHEIEVEPGSMIKKLCGVMEGSVNSAHHQAVEHIAQLFTISASSSDGVVEAIEYGDASFGGKPFLIGVQWHPERMDNNNPLSGRIAETFLYECETFRTLIQKH